MGKLKKKLKSKTVTYCQVIISVIKKNRACVECNMSWRVVVDKVVSQGGPVTSEWELSDKKKCRHGAPLGRGSRLMGTEMCFQDNNKPTQHLLHQTVTHKP